MREMEGCGRVVEHVPCPGPVHRASAASGANPSGVAPAAAPAVSAWQGSSGVFSATPAPARGRYQPSMDGHAVQGFNCLNFRCTTPSLKSLQLGLSLCKRS
ncbi:hypothetical protein CLOP_g3021 [Closterium sp. NIES-67]|nr:hypothetical protein CLOP_g3021 [Closterium sp. NIES-67]